MEDVLGRLELGRKKYGHGVVVDHDTTEWGTKENSWMEMAREEFLDAVVYVTADYIRKNRMGSMEVNYMMNRPGYMESENVDEWLSKNPIDDDNELIKYILNNWKDHMEPCRHKSLLCTLFNILEYP